MVNQKSHKALTPAIGIECHVQLNTQTKLFSAVNNDSRDVAPNTLISHIDMGMPGSLPVLNEQAVQYAMRMAFALKTKPQKYSYFERKHYFYPDLPKGYQITQLSHPIVKGGFVAISVGDSKKKVRINRVQLEEDAGKSLHPAGKDYSLVDLNRAGTPLLEIVSEPDMSSPEEARAYARELYLLVRYAGISEADLYQGNMRFDVNVSVSRDLGQLGIRTETKNINSFRNVERAVEFEIKRQTEIIEKGGQVVQETRGWDDAKQKTISQRGKEEAHDYRYFPDPDLPPIELDDKRVAEVSDKMPMMPEEWRSRFEDLGLGESQVETLLEAEIEDEKINYLSLLEQKLTNSELAKMMANWFVNIEIPLRRDENIRVELDNDSGRLNMYEAVFILLTENKLSSTNAKLLISSLLKSGARPDNYEKYASEQGFIQVSDESELSDLVAAVLDKNPKAADDVKNGEMKAIGYLVGQVMKDSLGKANPGLVQKLIKEKLDI